MSKYDEFDLNFQDESDDNGDMQKAAGISAFVSGVVSGSILTGCSDKCFTFNCSKNCGTPLTTESACYK